MGNELQKTKYKDQIEKFTSCCSKREAPSEEESRIKDQIKLQNHGKRRSETKHLEDHHTDQDDVESILGRDMQKLDRFCQFDKRFPFYKMDVNGFVEEINKALEGDSHQLNKVGDKSKQRPTTVEIISLSSLQRSFSKFDSWSQLNVSDSELQKFLKLACPLDGDETGSDSNNPYEQCYSVFKLKSIGILLCDGSPEERATELFNLAQPYSNQDNIACSDKDLKKAFLFMTAFATDFTFKTEPFFTHKPLPLQLSEEQIEKAKTNLDYENFYDSEVLDLLFGPESMLTKDEFVKEIQDKTGWILSPVQIRNKMFGDIYTFQQNQYEIDRAMSQVKSL